MQYYVLFPGRARWLEMMLRQWWSYWWFTALQDYLPSTLLGLLSTRFHSCSIPLLKLFFFFITFPKLAKLCVLGFTSIILERRGDIFGFYMESLSSMSQWFDDIGCHVGMFCLSVSHKNYYWWGSIYISDICHFSPQLLAQFFRCDSIS